jgi:hypothetical protein
VWAIYTTENQQWTCLFTAGLDDGTKEQLASLMGAVERPHLPSQKDFSARLLIRIALCVELQKEDVKNL